MRYSTTYFIMIFDYIESRRNYNGEHILKAHCKLCNEKKIVWHIDESSFMTTKNFLFIIINLTM